MSSQLALGLEASARRCVHEVRSGAAQDVLLASSLSVTARPLCPLPGCLIRSSQTPRRRVDSCSCVAVLSTMTLGPGRGKVKSQTRFIETCPSPVSTTVSFYSPAYRRLPERKLLGNQGQEVVAHEPDIVDPECAPVLGHTRPEHSAPASPHSKHASQDVPGHA